MRNGHARRRHQFLNACSDFVDRFDAVVDEEHLAATLEFHLDCGTDDFFVEAGDDGLNGHAIFGRRFNDAHVAQANERHMQRARNRRRAHGQHVDLACASA